MRTHIQQCGDPDCVFICLSLPVTLVLPAGQVAEQLAVCAVGPVTLYGSLSI